MCVFVCVSVGFIAKFKQVHFHWEVFMLIRIDSFRFGADGMEHAHTNGG